MNTLIGGLFPDELAWSGCSRLKTRFPRLLDAEISLLISGKHKTPINLALPRHVYMLAKVFGYENNYELFAYNHTYWPWIKPFLATDTPSGLEWLDDSSSTKKFERNFNWSDSLNQRLRVCEKCAIEDEQSYGEIYWHRLHQFQAIGICPRHPLQGLLETSIHILRYKRIDGPYYIPLTKLIIKNAKPCAKFGNLEKWLGQNIESIQYTKSFFIKKIPFHLILRQVLGGINLPMGCSLNTDFIVKAIAEKFDELDGQTANCLNWKDLLFPKRYWPESSPVHTLIIARLLGEPIDFLFKTDFNEAATKMNIKCFSQSTLETGEWKRLNYCDDCLSDIEQRFLIPSRQKKISIFVAKKS